MERRLWVLTVVAALLGFWQMGSVPLFDTDEPRYAQAAREMMERGDWVLPTFNGQPRYAKPVLFYWLIIAAYRLFGVNEFAARFWSGVAAIGIACLLGAVVGQVLGTDAAFLVALIWLTMVGTQLFAHAAITDMVLTFFMTASVIAGWQALRTGNGRWLLLSAAAMGLAVLTKGPVGFALPCLILLVAGIFLCHYDRNALRCPPATSWGLSLLVFIAIALPWYVAAALHTRGEFVRHFLLAENVHRYAGSTKLPLWAHLTYYPVVVFLMGLPWSTLAVWPMAKGIGREVQGQQGTGERERWRVLWSVWALLPVVVFTFSKTKNPQYVLLSLPAIAVLATDWVVTAAPKEERKGKGLWGIMMGLFALFLLLMPVAVNTVSSWRMRLAGDEPIQWGWGVGAMGLLTALSATLVVLPRRQFAFVGGALFCLWHAVGFGSLVPTIGAYRQAPLKHFAQQSAQQLQGGDLLVVYRRDLSSVVFYSHRKVVRVDDRHQLAHYLKTSHRVDVLTHVRFLPELQGLPLHRVERLHGFIWLSNRPTRCLIHSR